VSPSITRRIHRGGGTAVVNVWLGGEGGERSLGGKERGGRSRENIHSFSWAAKREAGHSKHNHLESLNQLKDPGDDGISRSLVAAKYEKCRP